jgi:hypothetical protein
MPDDAAVLTIEFKANLIAPAQGDYFPFRARVLKPGRTITVCDAQAFAVEEGTEKLVASILHLRPKWYCAGQQTAARPPTRGPQYWIAGPDGNASRAFPENGTP